MHIDMCVYQYVRHYYFRAFVYMCQIKFINEKLPEFVATSNKTEKAP